MRNRFWGLMSTITRTDMIKIVSNQTGLSQAETKKTIKALLVEIESALSRGIRVEFRGFGIWEIKIGKARVGRNPARPNSGPVPVPAQPRLRFKMGRRLKNTIRSESNTETPE